MWVHSQRSVAGAKRSIVRWEADPVDQFGKPRIGVEGIERGHIFDQQQLSVAPLESFVEQCKSFVGVPQLRSQSRHAVIPAFDVNGTGLFRFELHFANAFPSFRFIYRSQMLDLCRVGLQLLLGLVLEVPVERLRLVALLYKHRPEPAVRHPELADLARMSKGIYRRVVLTRE